MSTRAGVILKDGDDELYFYRHSDGYPDGANPTLNKFLDYLKTGKIRNNISQAAGWLVLIGNDEYVNEGYCGSCQLFDSDKQPEDNYSNWKASSYEPCPKSHINDSLEWVYVIDVPKKTMKTYEYTKWEKKHA